MEGIELRPRRVGEILDEALRLARRGFGRIAPTVVVGSAPPALVAVFVLLSASGEGSVGATRLGAMAVLAVLLPFSVLLLAGASVVDLYHVAIGVPLTRRAALRRTIGRVPALFIHLVVLSFMLGIAQTAISFVALLPLGVILRITAGNVAAAVSFTLIAVIALYIAQFAVIGRLALGVPALVVDRDGPLRAIGRSLRLTAGHTWSTGVVLFTASLLSLALSLVITIPVLIVVALTLPDAAAAVGVVVSYIAVGLAAYTFFSALLVVLFVDGRVRAEGLDLELTANEVGFPSLAFSVLPPSTAPWAASPSGPHR